MAKVQEIKTINFGEQTVAVEDLSQALQTLVYHYNNANQKDADLTDELIMVRTAKESLFNQIRAQFQKEQEEKAAEQAKAAAVEETPAADEGQTVN